jgi:protein-disulfide isomerase
MSKKAASSSIAQEAEPSPTKNAEEPVTKENAYMAMLVDDDPYLGPEDAPVVIVEFSDYVCPYCGKFYLETLPQILETYPDQVKFVHRDYLLMGDASYPALIAAGCALEQDKYWEMNDLLFSIYEGLELSQMDHSKPPEGRGSNPFQDKYSDEQLTEYAQAIGLDMDAFQNCVAEERPVDEITRDFKTAKDLGIWSIPVYIIKKQVIVGYRPFEEFQPYIEQALTEIAQ